MGEPSSRTPVLSRRSGACRLAAAAVLLLLGASAACADEPASAPADHAPGPIVPESRLADPERRPLGAPRTTLTTPGTGADHRPDASPGLWRTAVSLGFVLSLAVLAATIARRLSRAKGTGLAAALGPGGPAPAGVLEVLGRYPIARGQTLILLRAQSRVLLLAQSSAAGLGRGGAGAVTTLCEFQSADEVASILAAIREADGESLTARFRTLLSRFDRHDSLADADPAPHSPAEGAAPAPNRRCIAVSPDGDRAEVWDDLAGGQPPAAAPALHLVREPATAAIAAAPGDPVASLQRRLDRFRAGSGVGA